ncbi:MAG: STAS domain-containing protein [Acidimicrobiales bacterium]|nr:STAS domain-containing protein [Acidimicrobiales bacterium]HRW38492.1 STAS domain-containing protein [Aquihabitans sp.]
MSVASDHPVVHPFRATVQMDDRLVDVRVTGEVDAAAADEFAQLLAAASDQRAEVGLHLDEVTFLDSAALRVIVRAACAIRDRGGRLRLRGCSEVARQVLQTSGLYDVLRTGAA